MLNPDAPNPSIEAIVHAVIPHKFVDHTHADAVVALTNNKNGRAVIEKVYRPDLFEVAAKEVGYSLPPSAWKKDGVDEYNMFMDGKVWDPNKAVEYIFDFKVTSPKVTQTDLEKMNKWTVKTEQPNYVCPYGPAGCADPKYVTK